MYRPYGARALAKFLRRLLRKLCKTSPLFEKMIFTRPCWCSSPTSAFTLRPTHVPFQLIGKIISVSTYVKFRIPAMPTIQACRCVGEEHQQRRVCRTYLPPRDLQENSNVIN